MYHFKLQCLDEGNPMNFRSFHHLLTLTSFQSAGQPTIITILSSTESAHIIQQYQKQLKLQNINLFLAASSIYSLT